MTPAMYVLIGFLGGVVTATFAFAYVQSVEFRTTVIDELRDLRDAIADSARAIWRELRR